MTQMAAAEYPQPSSEAMGPVDFLRATMHGLHSLCSQGNGRPFGAVGFYEDPESLMAHAMREADAGRNVWFGIHPLAERPASGRGGAEDVCQVLFLAADLDWLSDAHADAGLPTEPEVRGVIGDFLPAPTIVVETGHGLQAYWELRSPVSPDVGEQLTARLHTALAAEGLKPERRDLASVLRVPGTLNMKTEERPRVRVTHAAPTRRYSRGELDSCLPSLLTSVPPESHGTPVGSLGPLLPAGDRPGDRWAERIEWRHILEQDGWTYVRTAKDGEEYWTRPGKEARDGISATIGYRGSGVLKVFTSAVPYLKEGETYSKFHYLAVTRFGGDHQAASAWCREALDGPRVTPTPAAAFDDAEEGGAARSFLDRLKAETYRGIAGLASIPPVTWLVQNLIQNDGLFQIFAPSTAGKSFAAIDLGACVATGKKWHGHEVKQGPVVYVVAEGAAGVRDRLAAWSRHHYDGADLPDFIVITLPAMLHRWDEVGALAQWCAELGAVMVIIDTYARSTLGLDENDNTSAGLAVDGLDTIRRATGAAVGIIHHTGHNGGRGRGASALYGAMETVIAAEADGMTLSLTTKGDKGGKQKNGNDDWFVTLSKVVQAVGREDEYGQPVTTLVLASGTRLVRDEDLSDHLAKTLEALRRVATPEGVTGPVWLEQAREMGVGRSAFFRHVRDLRGTGSVSCQSHGRTLLYLPKDSQSHPVPPSPTPESHPSPAVPAALWAGTGGTDGTGPVDLDLERARNEDF